MFCKKCGSEIADGVMFCGQCGEPQGTPVPQEQPEEPVAETVTDNYAAPVENDDAFDLNVEGEEPAKKERRRIPLAAILVAAGVLVLAVAVILLMLPAGRGFVERTIQSPEKLMYTAYSDAVENAIDQSDTVSGAWEKQDTSVKLDAHLLLGDQLLSLIASAMEAQPEDFEALSDIGLSCTLDSQDDLKKLSYALSLSKTDILTAQQYIDMENNQMFISIPDLNEQALMMDMGEGLTEEDMAQMQALTELDIDRDAMKTILLRYMEQYFEAFENVEKDSQTFQLQEVSQKLYVLEASISEKAQYEAIMKILEALKTDEDVKRLVESCASALGEDCYQEFLEAVDEAISDTQFEIDHLYDDNEYIIKTYLNNKNEIVGFALSYQEAEELTEAISCISLKDGKDIANKLVVGEDLVLEGALIYDDGFNGSYIVWFENVEILEVKVENLDKKADYLTGKIRILPSKKSIENIMGAMGLEGSAASLTSFLDFSVDITMGVHETGKSLDISLMAGNSLLLGLNTSVYDRTSDAITLPESYADVNSEEQMEQWANGLQIDGLTTIINRLDEAGLSDELMSVIYMLLAQMEV